MQFAILNTRMNKSLGWVDANNVSEAIQKAKIKFKEPHPVVNLFANDEGFQVFKNIKIEATRLELLDE